MELDVVLSQEVILIIILKRLLRPDEFRLLVSEFSYELDILAGKLHTISVNKVLETMGFPVNYKDILNYWRWKCGKEK